MTIKLDIVFYGFLVLFFLTAITTLLAIIKFGPKKIQFIVIDQPFLNRLFYGLLLEIITIGLTIGGIMVQNLQVTTQQTTQVAKDLKEFKLTLEESLAISSSWLNEPSDLTASNLSGSAEAQGPYALVVDDEESDIFVVEKIENKLRVRKAISFKEEEPEDLEAIAWDGQRYYYASTSFRQLGTEGQTSRRLLRFEVDQQQWVNTDYTISATPRDISEKLGQFLIQKGINVNIEDWKIKKLPSNDWHPWELEIEGIAVIYNKLLIGLKWPLTKSKDAILVSYDWERDEFEQIYPINLDQKGVSGLHYDQSTGNLLIAANPPEKERKNNPEDERKYLGESAIYIFKWDTGTDNPEYKKKISSVARTRAKLEGLAIIDSHLWLAYDGPNHALTLTDVSLLIR